jgi:hypothetical protein
MTQGSGPKRQKTLTDSREKKQMATTCFQWYHVVTPELLLTQAHNDGNNRQNDTSLYQDGRISLELSALVWPCVRASCMV